MPLRPIYYDLETTGIDCTRERIVEVAFYDVEREKSFSQLVHPDRPIPPESSSIHQITDEMVSDAPRFAEILPQLLSFCSGEVVLIAHNNDNFDRPFLREEFKRASCQPPMEWKWIDSLRWARKYRPDLPKHTLQFLRELYSLPSNQAHRALDDVRTLHQLFSLLIGDLSFEEILTLLADDSSVKRMPFGKHKGKLLRELPKDYINWMASSGLLEKNAALKRSLEECQLL